MQQSENWAEKVTEHAQPPEWVDAHKRLFPPIGSDDRTTEHDEKDEKLDDYSGRLIVPLRGGQEEKVAEILREVKHEFGEEVAKSLLAERMLGIADPILVYVEKDGEYIRERVPKGRYEGTKAGLSALNDSDMHACFEEVFQYCDDVRRQRQHS